jgi:hypothetical protein
MVFIRGAGGLIRALDVFLFSRWQMNREGIHEAISGFLSLLEDRNVDAEEKGARLKLALDRLALAYHFAEYKFDETDYPDGPRKDYSALRKTVEAIFPDYSRYNTPSEISEKIGKAEIYVGDAIDDITDIALDMYEVRWLWENTSVENALWQFRFGYESHWGMHLRCLQLYLLAINYGQ